MADAKEKAEAGIEAAEDRLDEEWSLLVDNQPLGDYRAPGLDFHNRRIKEVKQCPGAKGAIFTMDKKTPPKQMPSRCQGEGLMSNRRLFYRGSASESIRNSLK